MEILNFVHKNGKTTTELHEVHKIEKEEVERTKLFSTDPLHLEITFHSPLVEDDLYFLYDCCIRYEVFEIADVQKEVEDDMNHPLPASWKIKCHNFKQAFNCGLELMDHSEDGELWTVQLYEG